MVSRIVPARADAGGAEPQSDSLLLGNLRSIRASKSSNGEQTMLINVEQLSQWSRQGSAVRKRLGQPFYESSAVKRVGQPFYESSAVKRLGQSFYESSAVRKRLGWSFYE